MSDRITIDVLNTNGHCYACKSVNYEPKLKISNSQFIKLPYNKVDLLYRIYMEDTFGFTVILCQRCINDLKEKIDKLI